VTLRVPFKVKKSDKWLTQSSQTWQAEAQGASTQVIVPAGAVRMIALYP
jgi:hypothetical protein